MIQADTTHLEDFLTCNDRNMMPITHQHHLCLCALHDLPFDDIESRPNAGAPFSTFEKSLAELATVQLQLKVLCTLLPGRFTPAASVEVATRIEMVPSLNAASIASRSSMVSPVLLAQQWPTLVVLQRI